MENMETVRKILCKGITALLVAVIAAGISVPADGNPEYRGLPADKPGWFEITKDGFTLSDDSSAGHSSFDLPDADIHDTVMPPGRMIHPVLFFVQFLYLQGCDLPRSAPANPIYKPPKSA